jgi:hypothetical protein
MNRLQTLLSIPTCGARTRRRCTAQCTPYGGARGLPVCSSCTATVARAKAWCLRMHADASLSRMGARAISWCLLIHTARSVSLSRGPGRKPGASLCTRNRLSLKGGRANAWCLLMHVTWKRLYLASCTGVPSHAIRRNLATPSLTVFLWCTGVPGNTQSLTTGVPGDTRRWRPLPGLVTRSLNVCSWCTSVPVRAPSTHDASSTMGRPRVPFAAHFQRRVHRRNTMSTQSKHLWSEPPWRTDPADDQPRVHRRPHRRCHSLRGTPAHPHTRSPAHPVTRTPVHPHTRVRVTQDVKLLPISIDIDGH